MHFYTALHRFGWGPQPNNEPKDSPASLQKWLHNQLQSPQKALLKGTFENSNSLTKQMTSIRGKKDRDQKKRIREAIKNTYMQETEARFLHSLNTDAPFLDRLVHFWSNHFTVSTAGKPQLSGLVGVFEREAIRPNVLGKFSDMLLAVVAHPAMLNYLNNMTSFGPNSRMGKRRNRGLNENLAREILELHTLGVNGGYTQKDVIALAKIITGWTITPAKMGGGGFQYIDVIHEPGTHILLGKSYPQNGQQQGIDALRDLAHHPSTARFIATKLARHFIADNPPDSTIKHLEKVFKKTDGDLKAMAETLIELPEIEKYPLSKIKTPYELIISTMRLLGDGANKADYRKIFQSLALMDHRPFAAPSPAGWPDKAEDWISPNATLNRVEWCHAVSNITGIKDNPLDIAKHSFGQLANPETLTWIERAPSGTQGLALMLASPEWQRR